MRTAENIMRRLGTILEEGLPVRVEGWLTLNPTETLPDIQGYYEDEYEYEQLSNTPAVILFEEEPDIGYEGDSTLVFELPIVVVCWDTCDLNGLTELHRRLKRWRSLIVDEILLGHRVEIGYWQEARIKDYIGGELLHNDSGLYGRARGVRIIFQTQEEY